MPSTPPGAPTAVMTPPPAGPPAGPAQAAATPAPAPKKKSKIWLIIGILVVLLVCLPAACIGGIAFTEAQKEAKVKEAVTLAETHVNAGVGIISKATGELDSLNADDQSSAEVKKITDGVSGELRKARDEIAAARAAIEPLEDSDGKKDYLAALDEMTKSVDGLEDLMGTITNFAAITDRITDASAKADAANKAVNDSIDAGNGRKWSKMQAEAKKAASNYSAGQAAFNLIHKDMPSLGMNLLAKYCSLAKQKADVLIQMSADGKAGRVNKYNAGIDKVNAIDKKARAVGDPAIAKDPDFADKLLAASNKAINDAGAKADELHAKALKEFGLTD
jgi:hypothetical protein